MLDMNGKYILPGTIVELTGTFPVWTDAEDDLARIYVDIKLGDTVLAVCLSTQMYNEHHETCFLHPEYGPIWVRSNDVLRRIQVTNHVL